MIWEMAKDKARSPGGGFMFNGSFKGLHWSHLGSALSDWFLWKTGRGLNRDQLAYLRRKITRLVLGGTGGSLKMMVLPSTNSLVPERSRESDPVLRQKHFLKLKLPINGTDFTFWEWVYGILHLIEHHLLGPWEDGRILGFMSKDEADTALEGAAAGTFLVRFSDPTLGAVAVVFVNEILQVTHPKPMTHTSLIASSLATRINNLENAKFLYLSQGCFSHKKDVFWMYEDEGKCPNSWLFLQALVLNAQLLCLRTQRKSRRATQAGFRSQSCGRCWK